MTDEVKTSDIIILKKMHGGKLNADEMKTIIEGVNSGQMSEIKITAWLASLLANGMDDDEIEMYTRALINSGEVLKFDEYVLYDFHSLGGISGNKITPIVVSITSMGGLITPKTSTHAITSACGTVDFVETFCNTTFTREQLWEIITKTDAFFIMGGTGKFCPVDDKMITVQRKLRMNPQPQFFASILGKKASMGINKLVIDIPTGPQTKIKTVDEAEVVAKRFIAIGKRLGMEVNVAISNGIQPMGFATGPILEARECIQTLMDPENAPADVVEKACAEAGALFEMSGVENGVAKARELLFSGKAYRQFRWVVKHQGGNPDIKPDDLKLGEFKIGMVSTRDGFISAIDNRKIITIARMAGSPSVKVAGIVLRKKIGDKVKKGDTLMDIYSASQEYVDSALTVAEELLPFSYSDEPPEKIGPMLIKVVK